MSYILEALKKAEAERRDGVTHTAPRPPGFAAERHRLAAKPGDRRWPWIALSSVAVVTVAAIAAFWLMAGEDTPQEAVPVATVAKPPAAAASATPPAPAPSSAVARVPAPAPIPAIAAATAPAAKPDIAMAETPADDIMEKPAEKPARKSAPKKRPLASDRPRTEQPPEKHNEASAASFASIATLRELPAQIQREVPALTIGGYIYSGNRADRSVLINNRLMHEGDEIAPGLVLERMMPNGMVLKYKEYRYRASY